MVPSFKLGRINNKVLIIDILGYAFEEIKQILHLLYLTSKSSRLFMKENC